MAALSDETVQELNKILSRLGSQDGGGGQGGASPSPPGGAGLEDDKGALQDRAEMIRRLKEEMDQLGVSEGEHTKTSSKFSREMERGAGVAQQYQDSILGVGNAFQSMMKQSMH